MKKNKINIYCVQVLALFDKGGANTILSTSSIIFSYCFFLQSDISTTNNMAHQLQGFMTHRMCINIDTVYNSVYIALTVWECLIESFNFIYMTNCTLKFNQIRSDYVISQGNEKNRGREQLGKFSVCSRVSV